MGFDVLDVVLGAFGFEAVEAEVFEAVGLGGGDRELEAGVEEEEEGREQDEEKPEGRVFVAFLHGVKVGRERPLRKGFVILKAEILKC